MQSVKLPESLINEAKQYAYIYSRSVPKQIEYWSRIGRIAEENPELPYAFIKELLLAKAEADAGDVVPFTFE